MEIGIFDSQAFGGGCDIEVAVGGNQGDWGACHLMDAVDFERHRELHGVIGRRRCVRAAAIASLNKARLNSTTRYRWVRRGSNPPSAALADNGFRKRFTLDRDRLVVGVVIVGVGIGQLAQQPDA